MATETTQTNGQPTTQETVKRGFTLTCPRCLAEATITLDLDDCERCKCGECEEEWSVEDMRVLVGQWKRLLDWIDLAPARE